MKKIIFILLLIFLITIPFLSASEEIRVFIKEKELTTKKTLFSTQQETISKEKIKHEFEDGKFSAIISQKEFNRLKNNPNIQIEPVEKKFITLAQSIPIIEADTVWNLTENNINITGIDQTICVLDTGVDFTNPSLQGKNKTCVIDCTGSSCVENCSIGDWNSHGTHVAGIIAASGTVKGVAKNASLIGLKVCDSEGNCYNDDIIRAIDWCRTNKNTYNISVISMSLGDCGMHQTYCNEDQLNNTIWNAINSDISIVASAGNCDTGNCPGITCTNGISSPACIENVTAIGGTNDADSISYQRGNILKLLAPGVSIYSTLPGNNYGTKSGTSMSAPHVSGLIALINQYKKLESNKTYTPQKIQTILFNSGKQINDTSGTNLNFSRINAYQAILQSDEKKPIITNVSPANNSVKLTTNTNFTCNATDNLQFANLTIKIYNSTSLIHNISTNSQTLTTNYTLSEGEYNWSCIAKDNQSNTNITTYFLTASYIQTQISSPKNNTYTNKNHTTINCSTQSTNELSNMTINIYNSTNLVQQNKTNITGTSNYSEINYTFPTETTYYYNCVSTNNQSQTSQTNNYTITYDKTAPQIIPISPTNNTKTTTKTHIFQYTETEINSNNCNLIINNENYSSFSQTLEDGTYYWNINCTDLANNSNISQTYKLEIYTSNNGGGGGSSSSSSTSANTYSTSTPHTIKKEEIQKGTQQQLKEKEIANFEIKSKKHKLTLNKIESEKINITIESEPITTILYLNSPKKINLDNDETFDIELILLSTINQKANIYMKEINETIEKKHIMSYTENNTKEIELLEENNKLLKKLIELIEKILRFFGIKN